MYQITNIVHEYYVTNGRHKNITKEALARRLTANVDLASKRERIVQNKWKYYLGSFAIKVDHDTNTIYQISWDNEGKTVSNVRQAKIIQKYVEYGLNSSGNKIVLK